MFQKLLTSINCRQIQWVLHYTMQPIQRKIGKWLISTNNTKICKTTVASLRFFMEAPVKWHTEFISP